MKDYRLRNHIPISSPATREPYIGDEPDLRISLGFTPEWFCKRLGIDFSSIWHTDPIYRYESLYKMKKLLNDVFPMVDYFRINETNSVETTCATISGIYGITVIPQCYGIKPVYYKNGWPDLKPDSRISKDEIRKLKPFDIENLPFTQELMRQMDIIEQEYGMIHGYLNYQGIMNIALKVYGNDFLLDMAIDSPLIDHLFAHIADTILKLSQLVQERQRQSGFDVDLLSMSNCTMNMVSPSMYERFVLPLDKMLSTKFQRFGIHTCNWNATAYIDSLKHIDKLGYLDMGMVSDMERAKKVFPNTRRAVLLNPMILINKPIKEIRSDIIRIKNELAPCDIVMADIDPKTPDKNIIDFWNFVEDVDKNY